MQHLCPGLFLLALALTAYGLYEFITAPLKTYDE